MTSPWLEYRLEKLEFRNGAALGFRNALMRYNPDDHVMLIEPPDASPQEIDAMLAEVADARTGEIPEIKAIYYSIKIDGYPRVKLLHPLQAGARVRLLPRQAGQAHLYFFQEDSLPMFSKEWTIRDVTRGEIPSDKNVWQFHGWRHEH